MKEELSKLYLSEEFINADDNTKVEMTTKVLGPLTMPKDVYNDLNEKYKSSEARLSSISNEYDEYKKSKMTDEEKIQAEREDFANKQRDLLIKSNRLDVMRKLEKAGLTEEDYKDQLDLIVSEDADRSSKLADFLVNTLQSNSEKVKQQTQIELLNDTPKPIAGSANVVTSDLDAYRAEYNKALESKDIVAQAKYMRLIQAEEAKSNNL